MLRSLILVLAVVGAYAQNPCTEEVMRAPEIQLFANPNDPAAYLICTDVNTPISMPCSPGTVFNSNLRHCVPIGWEAPQCPVGTCFNNADCVIDEMNQASCLCRIGFTGARCEVDIDECAAEGNNVCAQAGGSCVDSINAFYCEFNQGQEIGLSADRKINRPCSLTDLEAGKQFFELSSQAGNVFLQCTGEWIFRVTKCADMLFWHQELRTCSIERPLEKTGVCRNYPCRNDGTCVDMGGNSFRCECKDGYIGDMCEEAIDFCLNKPCSNGGRCVSHPGGYNCVCQDQIVDQSCATGVQNPCGGSSEYLSNNVDATKYISCSLGFGFVKSCAPGLKWDQETTTCILIEEVSAPTHKKPSAASAYGSYSSYDSYAPQTTTMPPPPPPKMEQPKYHAPPTFAPQTPSYAPHTTTIPPPPKMEQPKYQAPPTFAPVMPSYAPQTTTMPPPPPPKMEQPKYQAPMISAPQYQARPQAPRAPQVPSYNQAPRATPAPSFGSNYGSQMLRFFRQ